MSQKAKSATSRDLPSWVDSRQERGLYFFAREEAIESLQSTEIAFIKAAARLAKKKRVLRIRSGFFIIVPLEYRSTEILSAEWFIADLMAYLGQPYYVGLLSAASLPAADSERDARWRLVINSDVAGDL